MASLIKNQILKHLSKFVKNLSLDSISVEVLRGRGELSNLELNEDVLTEVFDLPGWVKIQRAVCSRVAVKVPWTKLKSVPIMIIIDEITVEIELSEQMRSSSASKPSSGATSLAAYTDSGGYGYADRVVEGMSVYVNSLELYFTSDVFRGSFVLSRLSVESRTPVWQRSDSLRNTRLTDSTGTQVLVFKEVSWQTLRAEASAVGDDALKPPGCSINAPLRLITSNGRSRIAFKKSTTDGRVLTARLQLIMDDILWVATLPQVRSALAFYKYLESLVQKEAESNKAKKAQEKILQIANQRSPQQPSPYVSALHQQAVSGSGANFYGGPPSPFSRFDIQETSYHFYSGNIDLHICDDANTSDIEFPGDWDIENGAIQLTIRRLACDVYPYHLAAGDRSYWVMYKDSKTREWVNSLLGHYYSRFIEIVASNPPLADRFTREWPKLISSCVVIRMDDMTVHCVSTPTDPSHRKGDPSSTARPPLFASDKQALCLPDDMAIVHIEMAEYYYATGNPAVDHALPVPPRSTHIQSSPVRIFVDLRTIRWANYIYLDISNRLGLSTESLEAVVHTDIRVEAMMPRIIIPCPRESDDPGSAVKRSGLKKPIQMHIQVANAVISNCVNVGEVTNGRPTSGSALDAYLANLRPFCIFQDNEEQNAPLGANLAINNNNNATKNQDGSFRLAPLPDQINPIVNLRKSRDYSGDATYEHPKAVDDIWSIEARPVWIDFVGNPIYYPKPMPFVLDVHFRIWAMANPRLVPSGSSGVAGAPKHQGSNSTSANFYIIVKPESGIKVAIDHFQYLALMHTMESMTDLLSLLDKDMSIFSKDTTPKSTCIVAQIPWVEASLILPKEAALSPYDDRELVPPSLFDQGSMDQLNNSNLEDGATTPRSYSPLSPPTLSNPIAGPLDPSTGLGCGTSNSAPKLSPRGLPGSTLAPPTMSDFPSFSDLSEADAQSTMGDETASICTDISDTEEQFIVIDSAEASPFDDLYPYDQPLATPRFEEGVEVMVDPGLQEKELCSRVLQEQISTLTFKLADLELLMQSVGSVSRVRVHGPFMHATESTDLTLNEFHVHLAGRTPIPPLDELRRLSPLHFHYDPATKATTSAAVDQKYPIRMEIGRSPTYPEGYIRGKVSRVGLDVSDMTLSNLAAFIQDDRSEVPNVPMQLQVHDTQLVIRDGKAPYPVHIAVDSCWITQGISSEDQQTLKHDCESRLSRLDAHDQPKSSTSTAGKSITTRSVETDTTNVPMMRQDERSTNATENDRMRRLEAENADLHRRLNDAKSLVMSLARRKYGVDLSPLRGHSMSPSDSPDAAAKPEAQKN